MRRFAGVLAVAGLVALGGMAAFSQPADDRDTKREEEFRKPGKGDDRAPPPRDDDRPSRRRDNDDRPPPRRDDDYGPRRGGRPHFHPRPWEPGKVMPPEVRDRLKLTSEQDRQLAEIEKDVKDRILKLLTDEQKTKLDEFKRRGPPPDDRRGPPPRRGDRRGPDDDDDDRGPPRDDQRPPPRDDDR